MLEPKRAATDCVCSLPLLFFVTSSQSQLLVFDEKTQRLYCYVSQSQKYSQNHRNSDFRWSQWPLHEFTSTKKLQRKNQAGSFLAWNRNNFIKCNRADLMLCNGLKSDLVYEVQGHGSLTCDHLFRPEIVEVLGPNVFHTWLQFTSNLVLFPVLLSL